MRRARKAVWGSGERAIKACACGGLVSGEPANWPASQALDSHSPRQDLEHRGRVRRRAPQFARLLHIRTLTRPRREDHVYDCLIVGAEESCAHRVRAGIRV